MSETQQTDTEEDSSPGLDADNSFVPSITSSSSSSSGDELNVFSQRFNPVTALRHGQQMLNLLPFPRTRRLDNLRQYSAVAGTGPAEEFEDAMMGALQKHKNRPEKSKKGKNKDSKEEEPIERRFLPHQMPVQTELLPRNESNLLQRMEDIEGPLAQLRTYKEQRVRLCIRTRNVYDGTRCNELIAYIEAFDKHWNLALQDVDETYYRKKSRKVPPQSCGGGDRPCALSDEELAKRGFVKATVLKRVGKKLEMCKRHVPQMMLRGEDVVIITPAM